MYDIRKSLEAEPASAALPHNGDMLPQERRLAESLFKRVEGAAVIVATPTLAQGMNLPAQFAILAGNKRQDEEGRADLERHEILNAAGRAGRAGHLANGIVLLVPDPVVGFSREERPEHGAFERLRTVLPTNDQCVPMEDPITTVLDRIQAGNLNDTQVRYFTSRLRAREEPENVVDSAVAMARRSFAAFKARQADTLEAFEQKIEALKAVIAMDGANQDITAIAASTGVPDAPLIAIQNKLREHQAAIPNTIIDWSNWLIDFFRGDVASYEALLGADASTVNYVVRGKKKGGPPTNGEFGRLKLALKAWLTGRPLREIETTLGALNAEVKCCPRARDLVLKLANRSFYLIAASLAEVASITFTPPDVRLTQPSVLETLAVAMRKGLDTPDKVAYAYLSPTIRSRVLLHTGFAGHFPQPLELRGQSYATILDQTETRLLFALNRRN